MATADIPLDDLKSKGQPKRQATGECCATVCIYAVSAILDCIGVTLAANSAMQTRLPDNPPASCVRALTSLFLCPCPVPSSEFESRCGRCAITPRPRAGSVLRNFLRLPHSLRPRPCRFEYCGEAFKHEFHWTEWVFILSCAAG